MIPDDFKQTLLARIDIVDVVERFVPLKKAGQNFVACCPFHSEKTPSFSVSPTKQFYHCFGCGAHGNAIGFLMEYGGMGYVDAVKDLAGSISMSVPELRTDERRPKPEYAESLTDVTLRAAQYYKEQLRGSESAIAYLRKRGVSGEIAARFGIGYAPPGWQNIESVFPDYRSKALLDAGLVIDNEQGRRYDRFRDRIMFPIANQRGAIIGFGGRVLDTGEPKYLNSPETPLFEKGHELYGLFQARQAFREAGRVLVVEGYMDVVALAQHGVGYAVATLGTATTPFHVQKLLRQTDEIVYCFDGDAAGRRAAWRALENSLAQLADGKRVRFLFLPAEDDPDTYIRAHGREAFEQLVSEAEPLSGFLVRELLSRVDTQTEEGRALLLHLAKPLVTQIAAPALGLMVRKRLAELAKIDQVELEELFGVKRARQSTTVQRARRASVLSNSEALMRCLLYSPSLGERVPRGLLDPSDLATPALLELLGLIDAQPGLGPRDIVAVAEERFRETVSVARIRDAAVRSEWDESFDVAAEFEARLGRLAQLNDRRRMEELMEKKRMSTEEQAEYLRLLSQRPGARMRSGEAATSV